MPPPNSDVKSSTPRVTAFGVRAIRQVVKVKRGQSPKASCAYKKRRPGGLSLPCAQRKGYVRVQCQGSVWGWEKRTFPETNPGNLILNFQIPEPWENEFLLLMPPRLWCVLRQPEQTNKPSSSMAQEKDQDVTFDFYTSEKLYG